MRSSTERLSYRRGAVDWCVRFSRGRFWVAFVLAGVTLFTGCGKPPPPTVLDVPIYFTCDTRGRLEPCGCFVGQFGGLTRLKTVLDAEAPNNALRLDVGDAIGGKEDFDVIQYGYMLKAFAALRYDALNAGHREIQLAASQLAELKRSSPVPILSANVVDRSTREPIFDPWRIVERDGLRIGIIGVVDPRGLDGEPGEGVLVDEIEPALTRCVAELEPRTDLVVLLAFVDEETLDRIAQQFYELDVILGGKVRQPAQDLKTANRSLVYFVTNESRALGILRLRLQKGAAPVPVNHEIRLLHDRIPQDESFIKMANQYRDEIRRTRLAIDNPANRRHDEIPGTRHGAEFVGTDKCASCHQTATVVWKNSGHSHAFATLVDRRADADPKCIGCHTVGFGTETGYRRDPAASRLTDVGCESCHGPGSLHVRKQEGDTTIDFKYRPLDAGDCKQCHYGEFSRPFDWQQFWPPVRHGLDQKTARLEEQ